MWGQLSCSHAYMASSSMMPREGVGSVLNIIQTSTYPRATQIRSRMPTWPLVVTDPCFYRAMDPDVTPSVPRGNTGQDPTMGLVVSPATQIRLSLATLSPQLYPSSWCPHPLLLFHFCCFATCLLLLAGPRSPESLGSSQKWSHLCIIELGRGHLKHGLRP